MFPEDMKFPIITRKEYEAKIAELEERLRDLERHFVTRRDEQGQVIETLADRRSKGATPPKRVTMAQLCKWLSITDGGRRRIPDAK